MNKLDLKPHLVFWNSIPIVLVMGYAEREATVILNLGDSYYGIDPLELTFWIAGLYAAIGLGYWTMRKLGRPLSTWMNLIHMICTAGGVILIVAMIFVIQEIQTADGGEHQRYVDDLNSGITVLLLIVGVAQLVYIINWLNAWFRPTKTALDS